MRWLPDERFHRVSLLLFVAFFVVSCIDPPYVDFLLMQHVPTVAAFVVLILLTARFPLSRFSFTLIILFLMLHTLGARYLYSYTPYDDWSQRLLGFSITERFQFERNHYDRLVHFTYGLLLTIPLQEFEAKHLKISRRLAAVFAIECIVATSAIYEIIEWLVAVILAPDWAEAFNGQQGDVFDGQKDMTLATVGAFIAIAFSLLLPAKLFAMTQPLPGDQ